MLENITRNWWAMGLRALLSILFGIGAFVWPGITLEALVFLFAFYSISDGIFALLMTRTAGRSWGWTLFEGILSIGSGIVAFVWPAITALALLWLIAAYALITGVLQIVAAFQFRDNGWMLGFSGFLSIAFAVLLVLWPASGLLSLIWLIGFYALFFGFMLLGLAYRLYRLHTGSGRTRRGLTA